MDTTDQIVLVAFDAQAETHAQAVRLVRDMLVQRRPLGQINAHPGSEIESWFFPEAADKWADRNDRDAITWRWVEHEESAPLDEAADEPECRPVPRRRLGALACRLIATRRRAH